MKNPKTECQNRLATAPSLQVTHSMRVAWPIIYKNAPVTASRNSPSRPPRIKKPKTKADHFQVKIPVSTFIFLLLESSLKSFHTNAKQNYNLRLKN